MRSIILLVTLLFLGCVDIQDRIVAVQALCATDTECMEYDKYFDALGPAATAQEVRELRALCESDPDDKLDLQECP